MGVVGMVRSGWSRLRGWPRWAQLAVGLLALSVIAAGMQGPEESDAELAVEAPPSTTTTALTTTTSETPATTEAPTTTTTLAEAPEGGTRAGTDELAAGGPDAVARDAVTPADLAALEALTVAVETGTGYDRSLFPHWDDVDGDGCDTRCDVLGSQQLAGGGWFSEWDGATEHDSSLVHVDHVVALAEAWRSGAHAWTPAQRDDFADDRRNLLAVTASANLRKGDGDAATWFPSRHQANCLWARTVVTVKSAWSLTVDPAERDALANLLRTCGATPAVAPTTTTTTTAPPPPPPPAPPRPAAGDGDCTPGYEPCLPPAEDYDCSSGSGNGPAYTGRVSVDHAHGDPYGLDDDGDGTGCD